MNGKFYQRFGRIFNNDRHLYSSKDSSSTTGTQMFYKSHLDYILYELNNFILRRVVAERNPNPMDEINQYLEDLYDKNGMGSYITFDKSLPGMVTRVELSPKELLQKPKTIIYYTINEEMNLINFDSEDFKKWFRNEIILLLDLIELYKKSNFFSNSNLVLILFL